MTSNDTTSDAAYAAAIAEMIIGGKGVSLEHLQHGADKGLNAVIDSGDNPAAVDALRLATLALGGASLPEIAKEVIRQIASANSPDAVSELKQIVFEALAAMERGLTPDDFKTATVAMLYWLLDRQVPRPSTAAQQPATAQQPGSTTTGRGRLGTPPPATPVGAATPQAPAPTSAGSAAQAPSASGSRPRKGAPGNTTGGRVPRS